LFTTTTHIFATPSTTNPDSEMIHTDSADMADSTEAQEEIPKNRKGALMEQKKEEIKGRIAFLDALEIGTLASSVDFEQARATLTSTLTPTLTPMPIPRTQSNVGSTSTSADFAFRAKPLPELKIVAILSSINTGLPKMQAPAQDVALGDSENLAPRSKVTPKLTLGTSGVPITKTLLEQKLATLVLADGSGEEVPATPASSVRRLSRKQRSATPVATGD
jgi:hypothetical protein